MRTLIVDSNVISYIYKQDTRAALYEPHLVNALAFISFMTLAELERWAIAQNWGTRKHAGLLRLVQKRFAVIESNPALCRQWAQVTEAVKKTGRVIQPSDAWIAATALLYNAPLVTHNKADFVFVPRLSIISEAP
ncbi:MAG: PIN domain-containing protein [Acidobacteriota bacterium]